jgi:hypothetical protein
MEIECFRGLGAAESKRLKDAAPNLFHPTASSLFRKTVFFSYYDTVSRRGRARVRGNSLQVRSDPIIEKNGSSNRINPF